MTALDLDEQMFLFVADALDEEEKLRIEGLLADGDVEAQQALARAETLLAQLPLALVVAELVEYSFHRLMHEVPWLWRFHATHHSAPRLYWLNAARFHPIDLFLVGANG